MLLTVRDPGEWHASVLGSIHAWTAPEQDVGPPSVAELLARVWDEDFGGWERFLDRDRDHAIAAFQAHIDDVRARCPAGRLVEWDVRDGWESSCAGLGVEVPDVDLPHLNRRPS